MCVLCFHWSRTISSRHSEERAKSRVIFSLSLWTTKAFQNTLSDNWRYTTRQLKYTSREIYRLHKYGSLSPRLRQAECCWSIMPTVVFPWPSRVPSEAQLLQSTQNNSAWILLSPPAQRTANGVEPLVWPGQKWQERDREREIISGSAFSGSSFREGPGISSLLTDSTWLKSDFSQRRKPWAPQPWSFKNPWDRGTSVVEVVF